MLTVKNRINALLLEKLKTGKNAPYADKELYITSVSSNVPTKFPTLSVVSIGEPETDSVLEVGTQEAILSTIEIQTFSKDSVYEAEELMEHAGDVLIGTGYRLIFGPETLSDVSPFCKVSRFRRKFGNEDCIY